MFLWNFNDLHHKLLFKWNEFSLLKLILCHIEKIKNIIYSILFTNCINQNSFITSFISFALKWYLRDLPFWNWLFGERIVSQNRNIIISVNLFFLFINNKILKSSLTTKELSYIKTGVIFQFIFGLLAHFMTNKSNVL